MRGYWNRPEATAEAIVDGWLHTGDVATQDAEGYFAIVDRRKDMINTAGFKVWPREVEEALYAHRGRPTGRRGRRARRLSRRGGEGLRGAQERRALHRRELNDFLRDRLTAYKVPRAIEFRADLPTSGAGKLLRRALREEPSPGRR